MPSHTYKELLAIGIPTTLESLFVVLVTLLDTQMVSPLGTAAISAVAVAAQPKLLVFLVFTALGTATTIVVSQAFGREDRCAANSALFYSLRIALVGSIVLAALMAVFAWPIMVVCSNQSDTMDMSVIFLRILMIGMVFQAVSTVMNAALRGITQVKATLLSNVVMGVVDIIFNYLLIEGHLGFPAWGVAGSAAATTIGCIAAFIVSTAFLMRKDNFLSLRCDYGEGDKRPSFWHPCISVEDAKSLRNKLANVFCENILTRIGFLISGIIVARLGSYETSVYTVGMQLLGLSFAFGDGIQAAVMVLVGKCEGADERDGCKAVVRQGVRFGVVVSVVLIVLIAVFGGPFFSIFNSDAAFIEEGACVSLFVVAVCPFQIVRIVRVSVVRGLGDTKSPRQIATISALIVDPPFSFLFAIVLGFGQWGAWTGTLISQIVWFILAEFISRKALKNYFEGVEQ